MKYTREQMRVLLLHGAEDSIDRLMDWHERTSAPTLSQIEDELVVLRGELSQHMAEIVLEGQEVRRPAQKMACPLCQAEVQDKGLKKVVIESRVGLLEIERVYYYCPQCREGFFPPRSAVGVEGDALE